MNWPITFSRPGFSVCEVGTGLGKSHIYREETKTAVCGRMPSQVFNEPKGRRADICSACMRKLHKYLKVTVTFDGAPGEVAR